MKRTNLSPSSSSDDIKKKKPSEDTSSLISSQSHSEEEDRGTYFDKLPSEVLEELFKWLPIDDVVNLKEESALTNSAVHYHLKHSMIGLRQKSGRVLPGLHDRLRNLPVSQDYQRVYLVKSISISRYLSHEVELLFATVWRLMDDPQAWTELAPHLVPVLKDFDAALTEQTSMDTRRHGTLSFYLTKQLLPQWHQFLDKIDSGLEDRLYATASKKSPFEIRIMDILMCAPRFNYQLAMKSSDIQEPFYDVYGFFETHKINPNCQVEWNVFNSQMDVAEKKMSLMSYLRETVQRDNLDFFIDLSSRITDLEWELQGIPDSSNGRISIIQQQLPERYREIHDSPYVKVMKKPPPPRAVRSSEQLLEEYYIRCVHENVSFTGLHCVAIVPQQEESNLPLAVPFLRGTMEKPLDDFKTVGMEETVDTSNLFHTFHIQLDGSVECPSSDQPEEITSSRATGSSMAKPRLQIVIHHLENYNTGPSEIVINVGYNDEDTCCLTFHRKAGELLNPASSDI